ncbi:Ig-like domain-containing protein [Pseudomonas chlororaphis]|uniref:Ig-like domain-containing protein n=1 Tax=Pseudomonas chlororaphis TaxID=587753 RepID=UPI003435443D
MFDDQGDKQGNLVAGDTTDDARPTISGKAEAGSTVTIFDGRTPIGTAVANASGTWTFTPSTPLANGAHSLSVTATDTAGNVSAASDSFGFSVVAGDAPAMPTITAVVDDVGGKQGNLAEGDVTDDNQPTLTGTAPAGSTVTLFDKGAQIGSVTANAQGQWTFTPSSALVDGDHVFTATATNAAGNVSPSTGLFPITVDTQAPARPVIDSAEDNVGAVQGPISSGSRTDDTTPTLSGKGEAGSVVHVYDNGKLLGSATVNGQGNWSYTPTTPLDEGQHSFTVTSEDKAGNISTTSDPYVVIVDDPVPTQIATVTSMGKDSGISSTDWLTNDGSAGRLMQGTLSAALAANQSLQVSTDGGRTWVNARVDGLNWVAQDNLAHSNNWRIETRVVGSSGQFGNVTSQSVELDTEAPAAPTAIERIFVGPEADKYVTLVTFKPGSMTVGDTLVLEVGGRDYSKLLNAQEISLGKAFVHNYSDGPIKAAFVDKAGNISDSLIYVPKEQKITKIDFEDSRGATINSGQYIPGTGVKLVGNLPMTIEKQQVPSGNGTMGLWVGKGYNHLLTQFVLDEGVSKVQFDFSAESSMAPMYVAFFDKSGAEIGRQNIPAATTENHKGKVDFSAPTGKEIFSFHYATPGGDRAGSYIDNIQLTSGVQFDSQTIPPSLVQNIQSDAQVYYGGDGNNTFNLATPTTLSGSKAGIEGGGGLDILKLTGANVTLDLTKLPGKVSSVEVFDITGIGNNTLNLSLTDVLENGAKDLFMTDDRVQLMVKGNLGDQVNLSDLLGADGMDTGDWGAKGQMTSGGVTYNVYQHSGMDAELLVQQNVQVNLV